MSVFWRILIYVKRLCKMPAFIIALLLMPVIAYGIKNFTTLENKGITVGIYATGEVGKAVCEDLLSKDYVVKFEKYDSIEKMKEDVEFKTIECGYVFENSFEDGYKKGDLTRSIGCMTSNSSVLHKMINEVVYSSIITKQAPEIANNYLKDKNIPVTVNEDYGKYMDSDKLFTVDTEYVDSPQIASKKLFSVSNVVALYTMLGVVLLSVNAVRDRKKGIRINGYFGIFAGCLLFTIFSIISSKIAGELTNDAVLRYGIYLFVLSGFAYLLSALPKEEILFGILPVLAVTSVVLSPIFIDVSKYLKILEPLQYIYTVTYFAKADVMTMGIVAIVLNAVAFLVNKIVKR